MDEQDKLTERRTSTLSPNDVELIDRIRGEMPWGQWLRDAALEKVARDTGTDVDALDTARRPARRRRNLSERQQAGTGTEGQQS